MADTTAAVISIGNELTSGQTVDTNTAWISTKLTAMGIAVLAHYTIDDQITRIVSAMRRALDIANVVIISGGLGPTDDDLTRAALAEVMGVELELRQDCLEMIQQFFAARSWNMNASNKVQALCPVGAQPLTNPVGTAPGIRAEIDGKLVFVAPGVPFELKRMFDDHIMPALADRCGGTRSVHRKVNCFGMGESSIGELISNYMARDKNPIVGTTAAGGIVSVRITATAESEQLAIEMADKCAAGVAERLGSAVFGYDDDTLASIVSAELVSRAQSLAVAESCTAGGLGAMLTDAPGATEFFTGGVISYANEIKVNVLGVDAGDLQAHGAVSEQVAAQMAAGVYKLCESDYALAITGIAGPGGGTEQKPVGLVYTALASSDGVDVIKNIFGGTRAFIRQRAAFAALNMLRLKLQGICAR